MAEKTVTLYLIRHGLTEQNLAREYQGTKLNFDIHEASRELILKRRANGEVPAIRSLWVSPLVRARTTASLFFPDMEPRVVPELQERDFGVWDGKTHEDLVSDPLYRRFIEKHGAMTDMPEGEPWVSFEERLERVLRDVESLAWEHPEQFPLAFVFHGGPIFYLTYRLLPEGHPFSLYRSNGAGGLKMEIATDPLRAVETSELFTDGLDLENTPVYTEYKRPVPDAR